jgi:hypothetical protein
MAFGAVIRYRRDMPDDKPDPMLGATARIPEHVIHRTFESETVLLNLKTGQYHGLNPTGGRLLELLKEGDGSIGAAVERLAAEYDRPVEEIGPDLARFCADLAERGLIDVEQDEGK